MKLRIFLAIFLSAVLLSACKEPDFVDTTVKVIPDDTTETAPTEYTEDFYGYNVVYTHPHNTKVTDSDGNTLLSFDGCDYFISGELLFMRVIGNDSAYLIHKKDLSPVTADGKPAEFAHKFDEIALCEDGGFTAMAKYEGNLLRFDSHGELINVATFEKLFTVGNKPDSGDPIAAAADGDKFKFVTPEGEVICEFPFAPHLNYETAYYGERFLLTGVYFNVTFKEGTSYYYCPETGNSGFTGLKVPSEELVYNNNYISAYRTDDGIEVHQRLSSETHRYEDVLIGKYYDPVFGTVETEAVFLKSNGNNMEFYTYNYGSARKGADGQVYSLVEDYIIIGNALYDYHLNNLVYLNDTYGRSTKSFDGYSVDPSTGYITLNCTSHQDTAFTYTLYPTLPSAVLAEDAELVCEYVDNYGGTFTASIYKQSDGYVGAYSEIGSTLKLPFEGDVLKAFTDRKKTTFVYMKDGELTASVFNRASVSHPGVGTAPALFYLCTEKPPYADRFGEGGIVNIEYTNYYISDDGSRVGLLGEIGYTPAGYDPRDCAYVIIGDYIVLRCGPSDWGWVYDTSFDLVLEGEVCNFTLLDDGRYIGEVYKDEKSSAFIIDTQGSVSMVDTNGGTVLKVGADYIFVRDADGVYRLYSPDMELLCEFTEINENWSYFDMVSGTYEKNGTVGYYFVFDDYSDQKPWTEGAEWGEYGTRAYEAYYIPSTGEYGVMDNGYGEYALAKPVLYLYPTEATDVTVTFAHPERLTTVYPKYNDGWGVTAKPDGTLTDAKGREYYCLYWEESSGEAFYAFTDGFCVSGEDSADFLEEKLEILGFTEKEANEFIIYWLPVLEQSEYNLIRFELTEEREAANALRISPAPDSLLRMAIHIKPLEGAVSIPEQRLPRFERHGFTAVEWGGCVH